MVCEYVGPSGVSVRDEVLVCVYEYVYRVVERKKDVNGKQKLRERNTKINNARAVDDRIRSAVSCHCTLLY